MIDKSESVLIRLLTDVNILVTIHCNVMGDLARCVFHTFLSSPTLLHPSGSKNREQ